MLLRKEMKRGGTMRKNLKRILTTALTAAMLISTLGGATVADKKVTAADKNNADKIDRTIINIDGTTANKDTQTAYRGIGTVSCNGTSRLLMDYKEKNPKAYWEIMKWLFDPEEGAGLSHVKVELGCDLDTSSGAEPATKRSEEEEANVNRGAGFMFAHDAQSINPDVTVDMLCWAMPAWVGDAYEISNKKGYEARYKWYKETIDAAYDKWGVKVDYVSANKNEKDLEIDWTIYLANALKNEKNGRYDYSNMKIVAADETDTMYIADKMLKNKKYRDAVDVLGFHYNSYMSKNVLKLNKEYGKEIWFSEGTSVATDSIFGSNNTTDGVSTSGTNGMLDVANRIIIGYGMSNMTMYEFQPSVAAFYDGSVYFPKQVITANKPWSGYYEIGNGLVMTMHFTNFMKKGWQYITGGCYGDGIQSNHCITETTNDYLTAASPETGDYSTVIANDSAKERTYTVNISNLAKAAEQVNVWETRSNNAGESYDAGWLNHVDTIVPEKKADAYTYKVTVKPYSMVTLTTTDGQKSYAERKKETDANDMSLNKSLTLPYSDDFEYSDEFLSERGGTPLYTSDLNGAFEVQKLDNGNKVLVQQLNRDIVPDGWGSNPDDATTSFGDDRWKDYALSADVMLDASEKDKNYAGICTRFNNTSNENGYYLIVNRNGSWKLTGNKGMLASGKINGFKEGMWINLKLKVKENTLTAYINGKEVADKKITSSPVNSGRAALKSAFSRNMFDNIKVEPIAGGTDSIIRISDLSDEVKCSENVKREQSLSFTNYGRTLSKLTKKGDTISLEFEGTGIAVLGNNYSGPKFDVTLDGNKKETAYVLKDTDARCAFYSINGLDYGKHSIELKLANSKQLDVDAFEVSGKKNDISDESDITAITFAQTKHTMQYGDILDLETQVSNVQKDTMSEAEEKSDIGSNVAEAKEKMVIESNVIEAKEKTAIDSNVTEAEQNKDIKNNETQNNKITYTSSDIAVAGVSQNGVVYANGAGKTTITATANGVSATFEVNVAKLEVTPSAGIRVGAGEKVTLKAKLKNGSVAETDKIKWSADDTSKVKITTSSYGSAIVKTNKKGEVTITASYGEYSTKTVLHIMRAPSKITPDDKSMTIKKGKKRKISYELPQGSTSSKITYSTSNKKVATVSSAGVVKAKKKGKCTIILRTFNGKSTKVKIKVK